MSNLEQVDPAEEHRTYRQKPYWRRMSVAVAGSAMHFVMAFLLIWTIFSGFGVPDFTSDRWTVGRLTEGSPAAAAGVELGDRIVAVDGRSFDDFIELRDYLRARPGEEVTVAVERDGRERTLDVRLDATDANGDAVGFLGVGPEYDRVRTGPLDGAVESVRTTGEMMWLSVRGLTSFFSPSGISGYVDNLTSATEQGGSATVEAPDDNRILSIYGAVRVASQRTDASLIAGLEFLAAINVFIGIFNLVPLLPFDGGHVAIATYERLRSRRGTRYFADVSKLMPLTYMVVFALVLIFVSSLYLDIADPVNLQ